MTTHKIVCVCEIHQTHAYHIVNPSPWPLSVLLITSGLGILFHFNSTTPLLLGLLTNTLTMYQWWWDIQESAFQHHYTPTVQKGLCCGVLFCFVFLNHLRGLISCQFLLSFLSFKSRPAPELGGCWPTTSICPLNP